MLIEKSKWEKILETNGIDILVSLTNKKTTYFKAKTIGTKDKVQLENGKEFNLNEFISALENTDFIGYLRIDILH